MVRCGIPPNPHVITRSSSHLSRPSHPPPFYSSHAPRHCTNYSTSKSYTSSNRINGNVRCTADRHTGHCKLPRCSYIHLIVHSMHMCECLHGWNVTKGFLSMQPTHVSRLCLCAEENEGFIYACGLAAPLSFYAFCCFCSSASSAALSVSNAPPCLQHITPAKPAAPRLNDRQTHTMISTIVYSPLSLVTMSLCAFDGTVPLTRSLPSRTASLSSMSSAVEVGIGL